MLFGFPFMTSNDRITIRAFDKIQTYGFSVSHRLFMYIKTFLALKIPITGVTINPRHDRTVWKIAQLTRTRTGMIHCLIVPLFTGMTVPFTCKKCRHACNNIIMIIVEEKINPFLLLGTRIKDGILMVCGHNVDLILGQIRLKSFDFIHTTGSKGNVCFLV
jgi:hypothetical protein